MVPHNRVSPLYPTLWDGGEVVFGLKESKSGSLVGVRAGVEGQEENVTQRSIQCLALLLTYSNSSEFWLHIRISQSF